MKALLHAAALGALAVSAAFAQDSGPRVPVPAHDIERGQVITDADLAVETVAPSRMRPGVVNATGLLVGREARRLLRSGEPVLATDVRMPILVTKGSTVTMTFAAPGIVLTATGRAMSDGGLGESVVVQNPISFRQVSCVVTGAGEVRAADATLVTTTNP
jgi:flagellar basal body P-ring formation protein FlgA